MSVGFKFDKARSFFSSDAVKAAVDEVERKNQAQAAGSIRTSAQRLQKYGTKPANAGDPPTAHRDGRGPLMRKRLFFAFELRTRSTIIGPERLGSGDALEAMEQGKSVRRTVVVKSTAWPMSPKQREAFERLKAERRLPRRKSPRTVTKTFRVDARPFMRPALARNLDKVSGVWADSVKP